MVSRSDIDSRVATTTGRLSPFPACSLKAGYTARSNAILRTALQVHTGFVREEASTIGVLKLRRTTPGLHGKRVVCSMPLERARNP